MTKAEMVKKIEYLKELENFMDEIKTEADTIRDELKAELSERDTEELIAGNYIIRWTSVLSNRFFIPFYPCYHYLVTIQCTCFIKYYVFLHCIFLLCIYVYFF
jgi:hypothetical protein